MRVSYSGAAMQMRLYRLFVHQRKPLFLHYPMDINKFKQEEDQTDNLQNRKKGNNEDTLRTGQRTKRKHLDEEHQNKKTENEKPRKTKRRYCGRKTQRITQAANRKDKTGLYEQGFRTE